MSVRGGLVVLHSVQPLTTDVRLAGDPVVVLTDGARSGVARADAPAPPRVESAPSSQWARVVRQGYDGAVPHVVSNDEFCLFLLAEVRDELGLPPVTPSGLQGYLDKVVMKERLRDTGIRVPSWRVIDQVHAGLAGSDPLPQVGYPAVVKPRLGANSRGVRVIGDRAQWDRWVADRCGEQGWQVEEFVADRMCFVDGLVIDGTYQPVLVGRYLGGLLPTPGVSVLGAISVPATEPLWQRAVNLGQQVAHALGRDGRFATHLEFFDTDGGPTVMEVCARAPGALVSEMTRVTAGVNLETAHLRAQAGYSPTLTGTGTHAAWISVLSGPGQSYLGASRVTSTIEIHRLPRPEVSGRSVTALALLSSTSYDELSRDVQTCTGHPWYSPASTA